jgi:TolA-binding protein
MGRPTLRRLWTARLGLLFAVPLFLWPTTAHGQPGRALAKDLLHTALGVAIDADQAYLHLAASTIERRMANDFLAAAQGLPPDEASRHRGLAAACFYRAQAGFAAAVELYAKRAKPPVAADLSAEWERINCARVGQAEALLRLGEPQKVAAAVQPLIDDARLARSRHRAAALYYHGYALFQLKDYNAAGRALSSLAPFGEQPFVPHARFLLGRIHHLADERAEAIANYEAAILTYAEQRKLAAKQLQNPASFQNDPDERQRLEALAKGPVPDYLGRCTFHLGIVLYEDGKPADAAARFGSFIQQFPASPLVPDAQLRQGISFVTVKAWPEALKALAPVQNDARLGEQALLWLGRAFAGLAQQSDDKTAPALWKNSFDMLRRAAERNKQAPTEPDAAARRTEIAVEIADTHLAAKQYKEAIAAYQETLALAGTATPSTLSDERMQETLHRLAFALQMTGMHEESDRTIDIFRKRYPQSVIRAAVEFRHAENAFQPYQHARRRQPADDAALKPLQAEAMRRYESYLTRYPEGVHVANARYNLALCHVHAGQLDKAAELLQKIPATDRTGDLAYAPYLLADCLLKQVPADTSDALSAGKAQQLLAEAVKQLDSFVNSGNRPETPEALLKLGATQVQFAQMLADAKERSQALANARQTLDRAYQTLQKHALFAAVVFERAKCILAQGDAGTGGNELNKFTAEPLASSPVAPLALVRLGSLLRAQNRRPEAVKLLEAAKARYENMLLQDKARWNDLTMLEMQLGMALLESGRPADAADAFKRGRPRDDSPLAGECLARQMQAERAALAARLTQSRLDFDRANGIARIVAEAKLRPQLPLFVVWADHAAALADAWKEKRTAPEAALRLYYEAAHTYRASAAVEYDRFYRGGRTILRICPSELKAREMYAALIKHGGEAPLASVARLELAELHLSRGQHALAAPLAQEVLDLENDPELIERARLLFGTCILAKGDGKAAAPIFEPLVQNPKSPLHAEARYRAAECWITQGSRDDLARAAALLVPFRDQEPLRNIAGLSDRALLRLAHAYALRGDWEPSRQAHELLLQRYPQSPLVGEARFGMAWALQNLGQHDPAVATYALLLSGPPGELATKAQLQSGLCRLAQNRHAEAAGYLLAVPFTGDAELAPLALCEAARAYAGMKQPAQARLLLERVAKDYPQSVYAETARKRLAELPK